MEKIYVWVWCVLLHNCVFWCRFALILPDFHHFQRNLLGWCHRNVCFEANRKHCPSHWQGMIFYKFHCFFKLRYRFFKIAIFSKLLKLWNYILHKLVSLDLRHFQWNCMGYLHRNVLFFCNWKHAPSHWQDMFFTNFNKVHCFLKVRYRFFKIAIFFKIFEKLQPL